MRLITTVEKNTVILSDNTRIVNKYPLGEFVCKFIDASLPRKEKKAASRFVRNYFGQYIYFQCLAIKELKPDLNFKSGDQIGKGKYGKVFSMGVCAVKRVPHAYYEKITEKITGEPEAVILKILRDNIVFTKKCPCIILLYDFKPQKEKYDYIIMERANMSVWHFFHEKKTTEYYVQIILQVIFSLVILQESFHGFRHNDIKADNVLLNLIPRKEDIYLTFKNNYWKIAKNSPLVKIADFDYANIPHHYNNIKVTTDFSRKFGCTKNTNNIYDLHLFLNSLYNHCKLNTRTRLFVESIIPSYLLSPNNEHVYSCRLKSPKKWNTVIPSPKDLLCHDFFKSINVSCPEKAELCWGIL